MATLDDSTYKNEYCSAESTDDLEETLVRVAAAADARNAEEQSTDIEKTIINESFSDAQHHEEYVNLKRDALEATIIKKKKQKDGPSGLKRKATEDEAAGKRQRNEHTNFTGKSSVDDEPHTTHQGSSSGNKRKAIDNEEIPNKARKHHEQESLDESIKGHAKVVAIHYNTLEEKGLHERSKSRIFHMRNFQNWIKSMLINKYITKIRDAKKHNDPVRVHDMCCGKGGDLLKWRKGNITQLICSDIASVSLEQCKARYDDMKLRSSRERHSGNLYTIECILADCTRVRLRDKYKDITTKLDLVSCQFAFHYSFESLSQAECMMKNAAECLETGGYFIGTIIDANELMTRVRNSDSQSFGNNVYNVTFDCDTTNPPLFGAKYNFHLDGVVDCPEFLVHFPLFVKLAKKYGLKLVRKDKFYEFYERMKSEGRNLLTIMKSLETYPAQQDAELVGDADDDYEHAKLYLESQGKYARIGTLSKSEWEASSLYLTFAFQKVKGTMDQNGITVYHIN